MSLIQEKTALLRRLVQNSGQEQGELAMLIAEALEAVDREISDLQERFDSLSEFTEEMSSDLGELERSLDAYADEEDSDEEDEGDEEEDEALIEYQCPACGAINCCSQEVFELETEHICPACGHRLFDEEN